MLQCARKKKVIMFTRIIHIVFAGIDHILSPRTRVITDCNYLDIRINTFHSFGKFIMSLSIGIYIDMP